MRFPDDVDIDDDGNIYFTDASPKYGLEESGEVFFEAAPNGMVYRYNERSDELELLMDDLRFSNGIQLTPEKDAVLVSDLCAARIVKFYVKGANKGQREVFAVLPGFPDNIRSTERNTLLVALALTRFPNPYFSSILDSLGEHARLRSFIGSLLNIEKVSMEGQKYGLILEYDFNGNILRSWHDPTGLRIGTSTCVTLHKNKLYLGTFFQDFIGVVNY